MAVLVWDQTGDRKFVTGVDRGVLYYANNDTAVPWNGLTAVEEAPTIETKPYYVDGMKYLDVVIPGEFAGKLRAYTYPEEFDLYNGIFEYEPGMMVHDQQPKSFGLSYRTKLGDDVSGVDLGYRIHLLYNLTAIPDSIAHVSMGNSVSPVEFSWSLHGRPELVPGYRPSAHLSFDTTKLDTGILATIEEILYGSEVVDGRLPTPTEFLQLFNLITIIDHGDGTWSATGPSTHISMLDLSTFQIEGADAEFLDSDTYEISTSEIT